MVWGRPNEGRYWQDRFDALQARAPVVMNRVISMIQTAGQLAESGKCSEALHLTIEAKMVLREFTIELDEITTQLARLKGPDIYRQLQACGVTDSRAALEADLDLLERALREGAYESAAKDFS